MPDTEFDSVEVTVTEEEGVGERLNFAELVTEGEVLSEKNMEIVALDEKLGDIDDIDVCDMNVEAVVDTETEAHVVIDTEPDGALLVVTAAEDVMRREMEVEPLTDGQGDDVLVNLAEIVVKAVLLDDDDSLILCVKFIDFVGSKEVDTDWLVEGEKREEILTKGLPLKVDEGVKDFIRDGDKTDDTERNEVCDTLVVGKVERDSNAVLETDWDTDCDELTVKTNDVVETNDNVDNSVKLFTVVEDTDEQEVAEWDWVTDIEDFDVGDNKGVTDGERVKSGEFVDEPEILSLLDTDRLTFGVEHTWADAVLKAVNDTEPLLLSDAKDDEVILPELETDTDAEFDK